MRFSSFFLPLLYLTFTASSVYSHTHSLTHIHTHSGSHTHSLAHTHTRTHCGAPPFSLSVSHTHTDQKRKTPTGLILFPGMKNLSVFLSFSLSIIQFHNLDHNVGNLDDVQIADKANFLVYFKFFSTLI